MRLLERDVLSQSQGDPSSFPLLSLPLLSFTLLSSPLLSFTLLRACHPESGTVVERGLLRLVAPALTWRMPRPLLGFFARSINSLLHSHSPDYDPVLLVTRRAVSRRHRYLRDN